jgi:hypothetical protein
MKFVTFRNFLVVGGLAFLVLMSASDQARAQGRGRGEFRQDKKCAKFVNCHDASEGRLDGRGPRLGSDSDNWDSIRTPRGRDSDRFGNHHRGRHQRDRDFDRNVERRHRNRNLDRNGTWSRRNR